MSPGFVICITHKHNPDDHIQENEMGGESGTHGGEERYTQGLWESLKERDHLGDPCINGMIILKWIFKKLGGMRTGLIWLKIETSGGLL
jgi:hypothetical protein